MLLKTICVLLLCGCLCGAQEEILKNPGFENGATGWFSDAYTMIAETTEVHGGSFAVLNTQRTQAWQGPAQDTDIQPGGTYSFTGYVKLVDSPWQTPQTFMVKIAFDWAGGGATEYFEILTRTNVTPRDGWVLLEGQFTAPNKAYARAKLYLEGPAPGVSYYTDDMSLKPKEVGGATHADSHWEVEANQRIEELRKSDIHFDCNINSGLDASDLEIQIDHDRHLFGFGSLVTADYILDPRYTQYQNLIYYMFNWAVLQEYKWRWDRGYQGHPNFQAAVAATDVLNAHGLNVRGHCMFWEVDGNVPGWVAPLSGQALINAVDERITYMTDITRGKIAHWDVDNEILHGDFFKTRTGNPDFPMHMFERVHAADPGPTLFLNDYNVVGSGGWSTAEYLEQIQKYKDAGIGLGGVGVQSHMPPYVEPDPATMKARLDVLAQPGLPIWVTELEIASHNEATGADWLETLLRLYFSHPALEGILFWGFWENDFDSLDPDASLLRGYSYSLTDQGRRFLELTKQEWSTHERRHLGETTSFDLRGFHGDYHATVYYQGKPIQREQFSVGKENATVTIDINSDGSEIQLPTPIVPFAEMEVPPTKPPAQTSESLETLGQAVSTSGAQLHCVTRESTLSGVADDEEANAKCNKGEVLTGCSSLLANNDWHRDGEQIVYEDEEATCRAINGHGTTAGVKAFARCCNYEGLKCTYKSAGPSGTGTDDQVVVPCDTSDFALGCATHTFDSHSDGTNFTTNSCIGQNDDTADGVYSYAACCKTMGLQCSIVRSSPSGVDVGDKASVKCPSGQVMTGCNVFTPHAKAAGAYIDAADEIDRCIAVNGAPKSGSETGVVAVASCCQVILEE